MGKRATRGLWEVNSVYASTACLAGRNDVLRVLDAYAKAGLKNVELGATHTFNDNLNPQLFRQYGFNLITHNYFPPPRQQIVINLASQDATILEQSQQQVKQSIDFCYKTGIDFFSFHPGFRIEPDENIKFKANASATPYETAFTTFVESLKEIDAYARGKGVRVAVENHTMPEKYISHDENLPYLFCEAWEFETLWKAVPSDNIGILLDLGHLKVASRSLGFDKEEFIDRVKDKVISIHVHDNNGRADQHREVTKDSWCLNALRKGCFPHAKVVTESRELSIDRIIAQVQLLEKTDCRCPQVKNPLFYRKKLG